MSAKTKPDYGLPQIGTNVAATLVGRRPAVFEAEEEPPMKPTEPTKPAPIAAIAPRPVARVAPKANGRPKGPPTRRMHLALEESLAAYLDRAWRTHERPSGALASSPADLIEDLLVQHRAAQRPR